MSTHPISQLIKYDLKFVYKQVIVFYIIVITLAIIARLTNIDNSPFIVKFIHEFTQGASFGFSLGMIINASLRTWAKFKYSMYGDESYLSHTLPLKRSTLWNAKFLASLIVVALSVLVFIACVLIMFLSPDLIDTLHSYTSNFWLSLILFVFAIFCQFVFIMQCGLTGLVLGYRHNHNPMARSVIYGIALYLGTGLAIITLTMLCSLFSPALHSMLIDGTFQSLDDVNILLTSITIIYLVAITGTYSLNRHFLQRGVDVD